MINSSEESDAAYVHLQGVPKKVSIKDFYSLLQFTVFDFIWIQYVRKFCLVYHLIDLDVSR